MNTLIHTRGRVLVASLLSLVVSSAWAAEPPMGHTLMPPSPIKQGHGASHKLLYGRVLKTMDAGGYTYVQLQAGANKVWAAGPITAVKPGDAVAISTGMPMRHFHSKTLKRDFSLVYFSNRIVVAPGSHGTLAGAMKTQGQMPPSHKRARPISVKPAKHGKTIAVIFRERKKLAGKQVRVRGEVVKYIANIAGKNWIHIRDSSSQQTLLVITKDSTRANVILVKGTVVLDKDNGIGHIYKVVLDKAHILGR